MKPTASTVIQRTRGTILSLLLLLCLVACGERSSAAASPFPLATSLPRTALPPARYQVTIRSNASYGPLPGEVLDLCLPQQRAAPHPGVILIHGGGWTGGDKVTDD